MLVWVTRFCQNRRIKAGQAAAEQQGTVQGGLEVGLRMGLGGLEVGNQNSRNITI